MMGGGDLSVLILSNKIEFNGEDMREYKNVYKIFKKSEKEK
jgi:hypothetical protein